MSLLWPLVLPSPTFPFFPLLFSLFSSFSSPPFPLFVCPPPRKIPPNAPGHINTAMYQPSARSTLFCFPSQSPQTVSLSRYPFTHCFCWQQPRVERPHPRRGGSEGCHPTHRVDALATVAQGLPVTPSPSSLLRWTFSGTGRKRKRGNAPATSLRGEHQLLLVLFRLTYPKATADEVRTFIALHSANPHIYSRADITKREGSWGSRARRARPRPFRPSPP
jgi:hypothetical protein